MKIIMKASITAIALLGFAGSANAECPANSQAYDVVHDAGPMWLPGIGLTGIAQAGFLPGYSDYDPTCSAPVSIGYGRAVSGELVDNGVNDNGTPNDPTDDYTEASYEGKPSIVIGSNNSAFGNGSNVYATEEYVDGGADGVGDDPATDSVDESLNDVVKTRPVPVNNGTALGANSHVSHNNSTAVGAGAQSTDDHQVAPRKDIVAPAQESKAEVAR
jgi:hypothetical protein